MNSPANLRQTLSHLGTLPAIPNIAREILSLKITTDEGERALIELIKKDPAILSRIIGLANSPLFGTGRRILTLHDAAALLGIKRVKMVALGFSMMTSLVRKSPGLLDIRGVWQHSLAVG
ncbi:MAG: HDOD domain-containing protein, partial [Burkholderiales bacterium]